VRLDTMRYENGWLCEEHKPPWWVQPHYDRRPRRLHALTLALVTAASKGLRPHCSDPGAEWLWLSEFEAERVEAARLCADCPVIVECGAAADERDERWHVWAGRGYTRRPRGQQAA
jgi:hypothetical protein